MNNELTDFHIPPAGYALIERIKDIDGRRKFLTDWIQEIKTHVAQTERVFDGFEVKDAAVGPIKVRVVRRAAYRQPRFQYSSFEASTTPANFARFIGKTPPFHSRDFRLMSHHRGACREWETLEQRGTAAEAQLYSGRDQWRSTSPATIVQGLQVFTAKNRTYLGRRAALRDELAAMAQADRWETGLFGKSDGRLQLIAAKPTYTILGDKDARKALIAKYPAFVKWAEYKAVTTVSLYVAGKSTDEEAED